MTKLDYTVCINEYGKRCIDVEVGSRDWAVLHMVRDIPVYNAHGQLFKLVPNNNWLFFSENGTVYSYNELDKHDWVDERTTVFIPATLNEVFEALNEKREARYRSTQLTLGVNGRHLCQKKGGGPLPASNDLLDNLYVEKK